MKTAPILILAVVAAPTLAQSGKPLSRADFKARQVVKYKRWDLNRDGVLRADEMATARPRLPDGSANTVALARAWLAAKDANGDGGVSIDEGVASELPRFATMDVNRDGKLSAEERANEPK